jgi:hypothetical protein
MNKSLIIYGPENSGKYTKSIELILPYSKSGLKYKRKMEIEVDKELYYFNISDIHFEIDFELLGTNENAIWNEFIVRVNDIVQSKMNFCIILCRNFHFIDNDLLNIFYTFMRNPKLKFILCTKHLSYLPKSIKKLCDEPITLKKRYTESYGRQYIPFCDKILKLIYDRDNDFFQLREYIYQLSTYNFDIHQCLQYIYFEFCKKYPDIKIDDTEILSIIEKYNTNYRTIFHIEIFIIHLKTLLE